MGNGEPDRNVPGSFSTVEKATAHIAAPQQGVIEIGQPGRGGPALTAQPVASAVGAAEGTIEKLLERGDTRSG
jgi:hypothetical protein